MTPGADAPATRRTLLMTPGHDLALAEKAVRSAPDMLWLDLEDGVPNDHKVSARDVIVQALQTLSWASTERLVRINPLDGPLGEADLRRVLPGRPDGVVLTKIMAPAEVVLADRLLGESEHAADAGRTGLWCMIETPLSMLRVEQIATASPRVRGLLYGGGGLLAELQVQRRDPGVLPDVQGVRFEHLYGRSRTVLFARAFGLAAIDSSFSDVRDVAGTYRDALYTFQLGFDGKMILSPRQIEPVHRAFADGLAAEHPRRY
jgi:citrate lyase subunit beta / citryl-CoA lyase